MKKHIKHLLITLILAFSLISAYSIFKNNSKDPAAQSILEDCNKRQGSINMRIMPSCFIKKLKDELKYTKDQSLQYCLSTQYSKHCNEDILSIYKP